MGAKRHSAGQVSLLSQQQQSGLMVGKGNSQQPVALQSVPIANHFPALDQLHLQVKPAHRLSLITKALLCFTNHSNGEQFLSAVTCLILLQILDVALGEVLLTPWVEPAMTH